MSMLNRLGIGKVVAHEVESKVSPQPSRMIDEKLSDTGLKPGVVHLLPRTYYPGSAIGYKSNLWLDQRLWGRQKSFSDFRVAVIDHIGAMAHTEMTWEQMVKYDKNLQASRDRLKGMLK